MKSEQMAQLIAHGQTGLPAGRADIRDQARNQARPDRPGLATIRDQSGHVWLISSDRILAVWPACPARTRGTRP